MERTSGRRRRRRVHDWRYWVYWNALFCALFAMVFAAYGIVKRDIAMRHGAAQSTNHANIRRVAASENAFPVFNAEKRKLYPYSIIPGGLESVIDLRNAMEHDPLVAAHYANFNLADARIVRLDRDEAVHVSFRLNDRIYWTKKTLLLRRGETVISDGQHQARTRCGNRISIEPQEPVSPKEPAAEAMDAAAKFPLVADIPEIWPAPEALIPPEARSASVNIIPPAYFPIVGGGGGAASPDPPPNPPVTTPEPGAFALLALGILTLGCARWVPFLARKLSRG